MSSLQSRLLRGIGAIGVAQATQIGIRFIEVPLFLLYWGPERYGEWLILFAIPAYLAMADLGFNGVAGREMAMVAAQGADDRVTHTFYSVSLAILGLSAVLFVFAVLASAAVSLDLFSLSTLADGLDGRVIWFLVVFVAAHLHIGTLQAVFYGQGNYAYGVMLSTSVQIAEFAAAWLALRFGGGFVEVTFAYAVTACFGYLALSRIANTRFPWTGHRASFRWDVIRQLARPALASLAFPLGNAMNQQGMRLVIGAVAGPIAVATFVAIRMLTGLAVRLQDSLGQALEPEYARAHGGKDLRTTQQLVLRGSRATIWTTIVVLFLLWLIGQPFIERWTSGNIIFDRTVFSLLIAAALVNAVWFNVMKVAYATNRHTSIALTFLAGYTAACVAAAPLTALAGISGAAVSLLVAELAVAGYVIPKSLHMVGLDSRTWMCSVVKPPFDDAILLVRGVTRRAAKKVGGRD